MTGLSLFVIFVTSLILTFAAIPLVMRFAHSRQLYDQPDYSFGIDGQPTRRIHKSPMPRLGGIGMVFGFLVSTLIWVAPSPLKSVYLSSLLMFVVGVIDDIRPLSAKLKLAVQIVVGFFVVYSLELPIQRLVWGKEFILDLPIWLGYFLSVFVLVGAINAINLTDGLDGLAGGVVIIGIVLLSMLYFLSTHDLNLIYCLSLPLLGCLLGFLKYNTYPASIFMGDGGSNWLGVMIGVLLIFVLSGARLVQSAEAFVIQKGTATVPVMSSILCVALPVLDTAFVMLRRIMAGKNPMSADKTHFHHTLLYIGLTHSQSVMSIYFLSVVIGVLGITPVAYPLYSLNWISYSAIGIWILILSLSLKINENAAERLSSYNNKLHLSPAVKPYYLRIVKFFEVCNRYLIYSILSVVPLVAGIPHSALGYAALGALCLILIASYAKEQNFFQSFVISIASAILLTAINFNQLSIVFLGRTYNIQYLYNAIFIMLMVSTLSYILLTFRRRHFLVSPTDFLMVALPYTFLFIPEPYQSEFKLNIISLRSLIFFISIRVLTRRYPGAYRRVNFMCAIGLIYVFLVSVCGLRILY